MTAKRTYGEGCAASHALDLVGERWALLVVRELLLGPKRFTDLREGLPHASANVLSQRLRELEDAGVVRRDLLPPPAASKVYDLTDWGRELEPVVLDLAAWGLRSPTWPRGEDMSVDCHMLALKAVFDSDAAEGIEGSYLLRVDGHSFSATVRDRTFDVRRGIPAEPVASLSSDPATFRRVVFGRRSLEEAQRAGTAEVQGDRRALARFLKLFPLPEPAKLPVEV